MPIKEYEIEYSRKWTQRKRYDGYFKYNGKKYLIEFDGKQHFTDSGWGTKEEQFQKDTFKNQLAKKHNFELIRIECMESSFIYIKEQIYNSKLADMFDLESVDWDLLYEKASVGPLKEIADYYNTHHLENKEIARQLHYGYTTVKYYIKRATELGLINYIPYKYKKDCDLLYDLCEFFIENQNYSNKMLAKKYNTSPSKISTYLKRGLKEGIINSSQFTEDAYKGTRFNYLTQNQTREVA